MESAEPRAKPSVLVVDDSVMMRRAMARVLRRDFEVTLAEDGEEALGLILGGSFDAVLTDVDMPRMTGKEMYAVLLERDPEKAKRVVFMTGDSRRGPRYLIKPVDPQVLRNALFKAAGLPERP